MGRDQQRRLEELEDGIQRTRAHLSDTLQEVENRLTPDNIKRNVVAHMPSGDSTFVNNLRRSLREHPVPVLMTGIGLGWLVVSQLRSQRRPTDVSLPVARGTMLPAGQATSHHMIATHLGTQQGRGEPSAHRPEVVGEATHLGTGQGWSGYVHPG